MLKRRTRWMNPFHIEKGIGSVDYASCQHWLHRFKMALTVMEHIGDVHNRPKTGFLDTSLRNPAGLSLLFIFFLWFLIRHRQLGRRLRKINKNKMDHVNVQISIGNWYRAGVTSIVQFGAACTVRCSCDKTMTDEKNKIKQRTIKGYAEEDSCRLVMREGKGKGSKSAPPNVIRRFLREGGTRFVNQTRRYSKGSFLIAFFFLLHHSIQSS